MSALSNAQLGFILVCGAGLSTGLGAAIVFWGKMTQVAPKAVLAVSLGLSAGVMLYVSFIEIFVKAQMAFEAPLGPSDAYLAATASLFVGVAFMMGIDALVHRLDPQRDALHSADPGQFIASEVPSETDASVIVAANKPHGGPGAAEESAAIADPQTPDGSADVIDPEAGEKQTDGRLQRMGVLTALAIGLHNFPEGLATFVGTLDSPAVGGALALAIAIHNIPEGVCVSVPIYFSTGDKWKAFRWALLSGVTEPIGAGVAWAILGGNTNELTFGIVFGMVAGMMICICMHELIPTAHRYDPGDKYVTKSVVVGMLIMAASLCLFVYG